MIPKLEMLLALAKERHFGRAALSLGITQPTLSTGLRKLEEELGVKLVQRGSRFGGLTPEGQRALVWARQIVGDQRRLKEEMRASHSGLSGHLRIAVIPTALTWAARLSAAFNAQHPNVSFTILSRSSADVMDSLENLDADAGITYLDNEPLGRVTTIELHREHYSLLCGHDHDLAGKPQIEWADLGDVSLGMLTPNMQNRRIINHNLVQASVAPSVVVESNSTVVLTSHVLFGKIATILPSDLARFLAAGHDLSVVPIADTGLVPTVGLVAPQQDPPTPVLKALKKVAQEITKPDD